MRGYFGIGVEGISKTMNVGNLFRTAHAFGASFVFTVDATYERTLGQKADTSKSGGHVPFYSFPGVAEVMLPDGCKLVGVELLEDATELPSFRHPQQAAYVLGPERGSLSPAMLARCDHTIKIPMAFCVNVGIAGAIVMYDRLISQSRFAARPVAEGGPVEAPPEPRHGGRFSRKAQARMKAFEDTPPEVFNEGE
ncbi:MAG: rRNA methyltransferase [Rhodospirillales bacterium CG15_BIG_FIL_POST_REV_8_21_14_020_66_15]|nr:MAG: rRNA methyltransferase [Rhodospirillales bacterium CG15_BIG_FIL_POST_REV_8_21_14_020_66_15]